MGLSEACGASVFIAAAVNAASSGARVACFERFALDGGNIAEYALRQAICQFVLVGGGGNQASFLRVGDKASFKQNGGACNGPEYGKTRTLNPAVYGTGVADGAAVHGCGQCNVGTVLVVAGQGLASACSGKG